MTENEKLDLILSEMQGMKTDMTDMKNEMQDMKTDMIDMKNEMQDMKTDMIDMKNEMQDMKTDMIDMKNEVQGMKTEMHVMKSDIQDLQEDMKEMNHKITKINLTIENELCVNIKRVAEGHLDLSRNLHEAMKPSNELEMLSVKVARLETDVRDLKEKIS